MEITHHQFVFNTDNMTAFATGKSSIPTIYMNGNGLAFVQLSRKSWLAPRVRFLGRMEARRLALLYSLHGILDILDRSTQSKGNMEIEISPGSAFDERENEGRAIKRGVGAP